MPDPDTLELVSERLVAGGRALARGPDGAVVFVAGALPGERVRVVVTERRRDFHRAEVLDVLEPSPARIEPACPTLGAGCGGCDLLHARSDAQPQLKVAVVEDALRRLAQLDGAVVDPGDPLGHRAYRTTVRAGVSGGRAGYRRRRAHDLVSIDRCLVAHPLVEEVLVDGRFPGAAEITVRVGSATGERLVVATPSAARCSVPDGVRVVGDDELRSGRKAWYHEEVAGHRWRISARSFFQASAAGAEALVATVATLGGAQLVGAARVLDAYGGVGLLGGSTTRADTELVVVEHSASSSRDARHNLADRRSRVIRSSVERAPRERAEVVIADPPRRGLGRPGVEAILATGAEVVLLVSCDPASLGRDAALLGAGGLRHVRSRLVDCFPGTTHIEVVSRFERNG